MHCGFSLKTRTDFEKRKTTSRPGLAMSKSVNDSQATLLLSVPSILKFITENNRDIQWFSGQFD